MSGDTFGTTRDESSRNNDRIGTGVGGMERVTQEGHVDPNPTYRPLVHEELSTEANLALTDTDPNYEQELEEVLNRDEYMIQEDSPVQASQDPSTSPVLVDPHDATCARTGGVAPTRAPESTQDSHERNSTQDEAIAINQNPTPMDQDPILPSVHPQTRQTPPPPSTIEVAPERAPVRAQIAYECNSTWDGPIATAQIIGSINQDSISPPVHPRTRQIPPPQRTSVPETARPSLETSAPAAPPRRRGRRDGFVQGRLHFTGQQTCQPPSGTTTRTSGGAPRGGGTGAPDAPDSALGGTAPVRADTDVSRADDAHTNAQGVEDPGGATDTPDAPDGRAVHDAQAPPETLSVLATHHAGAEGAPRTDRALDIEQPESLGKLLFYPSLREGDSKPRISAATLLASLEMAVADEGDELAWWFEYFASARGYRGVTSINVGEIEYTVI